MTSILNRTVASSILYRNSRFSTISRCISTIQKPNYAFAFDIDGVLIKGKRCIPEATRALKLLNGDNVHNRNIPFVLLTNGGGVTEEEKARQISEIVGVKINPKQVILSHSPMQNLATKYNDKRVLIVGGKGRNCFDVAKKYGFKEAVTPHDIMHWNSSSWPHSTPTSDLSALTSAATLEFSKLPIHAVMVFHDTFDWGRDLQIMLDALCSQDGIIGTRKSDYTIQDVPLYWSNNDLIWSTDFPAPRLGQGAFKIALDSLYKTLTGHELKSTSFGKPHGATYHFAEQVLDTLYPQTQLQNRRRVYAVGDNPAADIQGANGYGWTSILVRTGVFTEKGNSSDFPADIVCENVQEAVESIIAKEEEHLK